VLSGAPRPARAGPSWISPRECGTAASRSRRPSSTSAPPRAAGPCWLCMISWMRLPGRISGYRSTMREPGDVPMRRTSHRAARASTCAPTDGITALPPRPIDCGRRGQLRGGQSLPAAPPARPPAATAPPRRTRKPRRSPLPTACAPTAAELPPPEQQWPQRPTPRLELGDRPAIARVPVGLDVLSAPAAGRRSGFGNRIGAESTRANAREDGSFGLVRVLRRRVLALRRRTL
jgi:hypothetical protein